MTFNRYQLLAFASINLVALGCGGTNTECGTGTTLMDGVCVPDMTMTTTCGMGTVLDATTGMCVPENTDPPITCATGTTLTGTECVPDGTVICQNNTIFDAMTGTCVPDPSAICEGDLVYVTATSTCVDPDTLLMDMATDVEGAEPNDPILDDTAIPTALDITTPRSVYGCLEPMDFDGDSVTDADWDAFSINVSAPSILNVQSDGIGGTSASVLVVGQSDLLLEQQWVRTVIAVNGDGQTGQIFLPEAGEYIVLVTDTRTLTGGAIVGGPESCYFVQLSTEAPPAATAITAGTPVTGTFGAPQFYTLPATDGQLVFTELNELDSAGDPEDRPAIVGATVNLVNVFRDQAVSTGGVANGALIGLQASDTITIVVDYEQNLSIEPVDFSLDVTDSGAQTSPTDGSTVTINHDELLYRWLFFNATAGDVVRLQVSSPTGDSLDLAVLDSDGGSTLPDPADEYVYIATSGPHYVRVYNNDGVAGTDYTVAVTTTNITPTAVTLGTANAVDLSTESRGFLALDFGSTLWAEFSADTFAGTALSGVDIDVYPVEALGTLDRSLTPAFSGNVDATTNFERIFGLSGTPMLITVQDDTAHDADETFQFTVDDADYINLGPVSLTTPAMRSGEVLAAGAGESARYLAYAETEQILLTATATPTPSTMDMELTFLDIPTAAADITVDDGAPGVAEARDIFAQFEFQLVAFSVRDTTDAGGPFDVMVSAAPPPYANAPATLTFTSICPSETGTGTDIALTDLDEEVSAAISLPVAFTFFGNPVTNAFVSTNGFVAFAAPSGTFVDIGDGNIVAPHHLDLDLTDVCMTSDSDSVTFEFRGATFDDMFFTPPATGIEMQVVLHSSTGQIDFIYGPGHETPLTTADLAGLINEDQTIPLLLAEDSIMPSTAVTWTPAP